MLQQGGEGSPNINNKAIFLVSIVYSLLGRRNRLLLLGDLGKSAPNRLLNSNSQIGECDQK